MGLFFCYKIYNKIRKNVYFWIVLLYNIENICVTYYFLGIIIIQQKTAFSNENAVNNRIKADL